MVELWHVRLKCLLTGVVTISSGCLTLASLLFHLFLMCSHIFSLVSHFFLTWFSLGSHMWSPRFHSTLTFNTLQTHSNHSPIALCGLVLILLTLHGSLTCTLYLNFFLRLGFSRVPSTSRDPDLFKQSWVVPGLGFRFSAKMFRVWGFLEVYALWCRM